MASLTKVFSNEVIQLFNKLRVSIKKVPKVPILAAGIPINVGDNIYALFKDGKEIFRGTKKEVNELAKKLDELGDVDAKKFLDELAELLKKAKLYNFKTKKLLKKYINEEIGSSWLPSPLKVKYLSEPKKLKHQIFIKEGKLYDINGNLFESLNVENRFNNGKAIFVMDEFGRIFASTNNVPTYFHHSSFLSGKKVAMAGEIEVINGTIISINNGSGHYWPTEEYLHQFVSYLKRLKIKTDNKELTIIKE